MESEEQEVNDIPQEIIECARTLEEWMKAHGHEYWQLNGVCDRKWALACEGILSEVGGGNYHHLFRVDTGTFRLVANYNIPKNFVGFGVEKVTRNLE